MKPLINAWLTYNNDGIISERIKLNKPNYTYLAMNCVNMVPDKAYRRLIHYLELSRTYFALKKLVV